MKIGDLDVHRIGYGAMRVIEDPDIWGPPKDHDEAVRVLRRALRLGVTLIDTADSYPHWAPGNSGGESETIIGNWLARDPSKRDRVHVLTKVGSGMPGTGGDQVRTTDDDHNEGPFAR